MNDNVPNSTVYADRDKWIAEAQAAWQQVAELRHELGNALSLLMLWSDPAASQAARVLIDGGVKSGRVLLERTRK